MDFNSGHFVVKSFLPLPVLSMMLPKFHPSACILQQKYLVLVNSASLLICPAGYFLIDFVQKYHVLYGGYISVFLHVMHSYNHTHKKFAQWFVIF
jgi:hypothetical protein